MKPRYTVTVFGYVAITPIKHQAVIIGHSCKGFRVHLSASICGKLPMRKSKPIYTLSFHHAIVQKTRLVLKRFISPANAGFFWPEFSLLKRFALRFHQRCVKESSCPLQVGSGFARR